MLTRLHFGRPVAGLVIVIAGSLLLFFNNPPAIQVLAYFLPAVSIQLLQGSARPYLGWAGAFLILGSLAGSAFVPADRVYDPYSQNALPVLVAFVGSMLALALGTALVGFSMVGGRYFPGAWGYAVAISAIAPVLIPLPVSPLAIVYVLLGARTLLSTGPATSPTA